MQRAISQKHYQSISISPLQNKFRTKRAKLQNKFRTKRAKLQNKFATTIKFVVHSIGKRYSLSNKYVGFEHTGYQCLDN